MRRLITLRPEYWQSDLLNGVLRVMLVLGTVVCVPSVYMALRERLYVVAVGDSLALVAVAALLYVKPLGYAVRAAGLSSILYLLGAMLLVFVGPVSQIYLLGFSVMTTALLGLRVGLVTVGINGLTLAGFGYAGVTSPSFVLPGWIGDGTGWSVLAMNFLLVNCALVMAVGAVLRTLDLGLKRAAEVSASLKQSEAFLRMASEVGRMGAWSLSLPERVLTWSKETRTIHEVSPDFVPNPLEALLFYIPEDRPRMAEAVERCVLTGVPFDLELQIDTAKGHRRWARAIGRAVRDEFEAVVRVQGTFQDITEQKQAEGERRELSEVLEKAQDAISVRDLDGTLRFMNPKAEALYGWERAAALGKNVRNLQFSQDPERFQQASDATLRDGTWTGELTLATRSGQTVQVEGLWTLLRREGGEAYGILDINTDITERKRLEQHLLRAQRMESIGTLAGGIAHDLNNVLTPILTSVAFLRSAEVDAEKLEDIALLEASAQRGADMVRQLLMFARGDADQARVVVDVVAVAKDVLRMVRETFPKNVVGELTTGSDVWPVRADPTQIHQLLTNLCVNARDAMPGGGRLTVGVEGVMVDEVYAGMTVNSQAGAYVLVRVEDTGVGMSQAVQDRIFEPFFTTKELGKGTGLGLSTCHTIARNLGGFLHVYSEIGNGTRFKIYLPADVSGEQPELAPEAEVALPRGNGELVLVVDDEPSILRITQRTLTRFGYQVLTAENGAEAVAVYARHAGRVALVLTDMSMPVMDGRATLAALRSMEPGLKIIGSSGLDAAGPDSAALGEGLSAFIPKPYTAETLLQVVSRVLQEGAASDAGVKDRA